MEKSTHKVEVVRIKLEPHPNADRLQIARVFDYTCCVALGQFRDGDLAAYIVPDSVVPDRPEFAFLGDHRRIKVRKMRGVVSMGLLVPAPPGAKEGDDVAGILGVERYVPPESASTDGTAEPPPEGYRPAFDVDTWYRYAKLFRPGEEVHVTEKIHGTSGRWCWHGGRLYCGSRTDWKVERPDIVWWKVAAENPELPEFCRSHPDLTVYGEVYGWVQDLRYGKKAKGQVDYAVFDLLKGSTWLPPAEARQIGAALKWVPLIAVMKYDPDAIRALADGPSLIPGAAHLREGIVVKPSIERTSPEIGRVQLKIVSNAYLERA